MLRQIVDLHIHSRYSRACSKDLELPQIAETCALRGLDIVTTGDFTHPKWFESIRTQLTEENEGVYQLKVPNTKFQMSKTKFIIGTEVASIKKHKDKTRRVHHLLFAPSIAVAEKFNKELDRRGFNLKADGRPILGLTSKDLLQIMLEIDDRMVMIPAHAWTPWFGIFGSKGGYDTLLEAYDDLTPHIRAIETGLSSNPCMNWRVSNLDSITLISNSDAHSPQKLGREANVFSFQEEKEVTYTEIMRIIQEGDKKKFIQTLEFYPEEGKYHYDGHRECQVVFHPEETKKHGGLCPVCGRPLTIGVMNRVEEIADRTETEAEGEKMARIPYLSLVPLREIIANVLHVGVGAKQVSAEYDKLVQHFGSEFALLLDASLEAIENISPGLGKAVGRVRAGSIHIEPGYDGVFGVIEVFKDEERPGMKQIGLDLE